MEGESSKRQVLHRQAREMIFRVFNFFKREAEAGMPLCDVARAQERTSGACGVGVRSVQRIVSEAKKSSANLNKSIQFRSPNKNRNRKKPVTDLDGFNKDVLRRTIFDMYTAGEFPTAEKLVVRMKEAVGFEGSARSMLRILKGMGFKYAKCNDGRKFLMERSDIAAARIKFLRQMHEIRQTGQTNIFYLDETWVNQNHTRSQCWKMSDGSGGLKVPIGKGGRLIVCHAGSATTGFIPESKLVFRSRKSTGDYHSEMNADTFKKWFVHDFLPYLPAQSVIVMDNASYHSKLLDKAPTSCSKKADIISWLNNKNIPHTSSQTRPELLDLVRLHKGNVKNYELDSIAREKGHKVVRLPPYHCQYNPIELVWAQVKGYVAERNTTFKIADTERLVHEAIASVSPSAWTECVRHAETLQDGDFRREIAVDQALEPIIVNLQESSASESDSESSEEGVSDIE